MAAPLGPDESLLSQGKVTPPPGLEERLLGRGSIAPPPGLEAPLPRQQQRCPGAPEPCRLSLPPQLPAAALAPLAGLVPAPPRHAPPPIFAAPQAGQAAFAQALLSCPIGEPARGSAAWGGQPVPPPPAGCPKVPPASKRAPPPPSVAPAALPSSDTQAFLSGPPAAPAAGSAELPTIGSAGHPAGSCTPCAFFHKCGCQRGLGCPYCHLCDAGEVQRRRKTKRAALSLKKAAKHA